jgi:hypothetical protein
MFYARSAIPKYFISRFNINNTDYSEAAEPSRGQSK